MGVAAPVGLAFALLAELIEWLLVYGMIIVWSVTLGWLLLYLANHLRFHVHIPALYDHHFDFGGVFRTAHDGIQAWLVAEKDGLDIEIGWTWNQLRAIWHSTALAVEWVAREADASFDWLERVKLPKWAKWAALAALPPALLAKLIAEAVARLHPTLTKTVKTVGHDLPTQIVKYVPYVSAVALPSPWAFPRFRHWVRDIAEWRKVTGMRLRRLEALLAASGLALAVARMTGTSFKCWRGQGNIARALRHICGVPKWLLDVFLLGVVEGFVVTNLCEFSWLLRKAAEAEVPALMTLVSVEDALIDCHGSVEPLPFDLPSADLPPLQGVSPLAA